MTKPSKDFDLAIETLGPECRALLGSENLERDGAFVANVAGEVDSCHSTLPQLALESVPAGEGIAEICGNAGRASHYLIL